MRSLRTAAVAGLFAATSLAAAPLSDQLVRTLETTPDATQRVLVVMKDAPGARAALQSVKGDRASVAAALRQNAALAQADLLADIDAQGFASTANVKTSWLANTVILDGTREQILALAARDDVKAVEHNGTVSLPPFQASDVTPGKNAEGDDATATWGIHSTKVLEARSTYAVDGSGVLVGVLDTGYDAAHPLLAGKVAAWKSFISDDQTDPMDDNGHGSHVAGTIGGSAGDGPEIGMAPGVQFVVGKILSGSGSGSWEGVISGMEWVVDPDGEPNSGDEPRLVSNSWGGGRGSEALHAAVKSWVELGIAPIFAAGNSGPGSSTMGYPGAYREAYSVGATTVDDGIASFSSRGPATVDGETYIQPDISAPGKDVKSVKAGGGYWTISGTSMATPHVAGLSALLFQANPDLTIDQLYDAINSTSIDEGGEGKDNDFGEGRIDALAALGIVISGGKIVGSVKDTDGAGIAHADLVVQETGVKVRLAEDGSFRMTLPEGDYTLAVSAFGFVAQDVADVTVAAGEETQVHVTMDRAASGTVSGTVRGEGAPVQAEVRVLDTPLAAIDTQADGSFSLSLPAGTYTLSANAYGFDPSKSAEFTVEANGSTTVDVDLDKLPPVLVIDDDDGKDYESFYAAALGDAAHRMVGYDDMAGALDAHFLAQFEVVVWFTGADYSGSLTDADQSALADYLASGGRLFLTGQDIGYELRSKSFLQDHLGAKYVKDTAGDKNVEAFGHSFSIEGGDGANNQRYPDVIEAQGSGEVVASYGDGTVAGTKVEAGDSRVVYFSFGFEGIDSAETRAAVMAGVLEYLSPSAAEMAARADRLAATGDAEDARVAEALTELVSTRVEAEGLAPVAADAGRNVRRMGFFGELYE